MFDALIAFITYLGVAIGLLAMFIFVYVIFTPYNEFKLIDQDNLAVAITLSGATLGFIMPMMSSIYYTHSLFEMASWAAITCAVQLLLFLVIRKKYAKKIEGGSVPSALFVATLSISVGLLNAVSISH